jgi:hypothetical protein
MPACADSSFCRRAAGVPGHSRRDDTDRHMKVAPAVWNFLKFCRKSAPILNDTLTIFNALI